MTLKEFFDRPESSPVKIVFGVGAFLIASFFILVSAFPRLNFLTGLVNPADSVGISITLTSLPGTQQVESGIYGVGVAKLYDELSTETDWLNTTKDLMSDLSPNNLRYPTGGLVKYMHVFTEHMSQTLTADELSHTVNVGAGEELLGVGYITKDRIDEEAIGNDGELAEITDPKPAYGNLSYLDGFQYTKSRNFIHDYLEIADSANAGTLYVVNMRYASPAEVADQVKFLVDNGQTIKGVEMENESYAKGGFYYISGNPSVNAPIAVTNYLNDADEYRSAIESKVPGLSYAVVAAPKKGVQETADGFDSDTDFNGYWNTALAMQMGSHGYSNYIMHFYAPFSSCTDEITTGDRDAIFSCGVEDLRILRKDHADTELETVFPALLDWYADKFSGKKMWLTEWNINQDSTKTDSKFANSLLHGIFTQNILTMINDANVRHGNYIDYASYHTFATDGGNAMVNKHVSKGAGNSEPYDVGGFVRRTSYYAFMSMKNIYKDGYTPLETTFVLDNADVNASDITINGYKRVDGTIALAFTNETQKTLIISSIVIDGQIVDLGDTDSTLYALDGDSNYASRGDTEFAVNPGHEVTIRDNVDDTLSDNNLPGYGLGSIIFTPEYIALPIPEGTPSPDNNTSYNEQTITYATTPLGTALKFDLSRPDDAIHPLPLVFFLHGGQFGPGGTNAAEGYIDDFTGAGYAVAEVAYRAITESGFPSQLQDIKGAIRYIRAHSALYNIDPDRIAVLGTSSGGMIMSLVGTTGNSTDLEGSVGGNTSYSSRPDATVDLFGSIDPSNPFNLATTVATGFKDWVGCEPLDPCSTEIQPAIAANYADSTDAPFLIIHGTADVQVMYANSPVLDGILDAAGMSSTFISAPGIGHDKDAILTNYMTNIVSFLDDTLYGVAPIDEPLVTGVVQVGDNDWSLKINDIEKQPHFNSVYAGYDTPVTMKILDPVTQAVIVEVSDLTNKNTNLNELAPAGTEYLLRFYDAYSSLMEPIWANIKVLDGTPPDTLAPSQPSGLNFTDVGDTSVSLVWNPSTDNVSVTEYNVYMNGVLITQTANTSVSVGTLTPGEEYTFTVSAKDGSGNVSPISAPLIVTTTGGGCGWFGILFGTCEDATPPTISFSYPSYGSVLDEDGIILSVNAEDNTKIKNVQFKIDGTNLGAPVNDSPYKHEWYPGSVINGLHTIEATATDIKDNQTTTTITISVSVHDTIAPNVSLTSPSNSSIIVIPKTSIAAEANDNKGISKVEFYIDGLGLVNSDNTAPYKYEWITTTVPSGKYVIYAKAYDFEGNSSISQSVKVKK